MVEYLSQNIVSSALTSNDIDYLCTQILTARSIASSEGKITEVGSSLYEAAKTLLHAIKYAKCILDVNRIDITIIGHYPETDNDMPVVDIRIEGHPAIPECSDIKLIGNMSFEPLDRNNPDIKQYQFVFRLYTQIMRVIENTSSTDYQIPSGSYSIVYDYVQLRNSNMVLSYAENFPMPTVFCEHIRQSLNQFLKQ